MVAPLNSDDSEVTELEREAMLSLIDRAADKQASLMFIVKAAPDGVANAGVLVIRGSTMIAAVAMFINKLFSSGKETVN